MPIDGDDGVLYLQDGVGLRWVARGTSPERDKVRTGRSTDVTSPIVQSHHRAV